MMTSAVHRRRCASIVSMLLALCMGSAVTRSDVHARTRTSFVPVVSEITLCTVPAEIIKNRGVVVSPDGRRIAFHRYANGKAQLFINGAAVIDLDTGLNDIRFGYFRFSPEGSRFACPIRIGNREHLLVDGVRGPGYDDLVSPVFSPDGGRIAHIARTKDDVFVVLDGVGGARYSQASMLSFSPDGRHLFYVAQKKKRGMFFPVLDSVEGPGHDQIHSFAWGPIGREHAYVAIDIWSFLGQVMRFKQSVVRNGLEMKRYPAIVRETLAYRSDGALLFVAYADDLKRQALVVNGVEGELYGRIGKIVLAGAHYAFIASSSDGQRVVRDGVAGELFPEAGEPVFCNGGRRLAYVAQKNYRYRVVVDGIPGREFYLVSGQPVFSPDGSRLAYAATDGKKSMMVVDGVERAAYDEVSRTPVFSPDGRHVAYFARRGNGWLVVVDDQEIGGFTSFIGKALPSEPFWEPPPWQGPVFTSPTSLYALMSRVDRVVRVEIEIKR